ncbi:hypothetical protein EVG20_g9192 [Dentipellis fragilis]|uniref:BHLH domain-containing protein n=1 Tax=Dentipellis fragilis TaxID=205917 RepID=A0A4Y9Y043_9AGAM|nr:hypothetical protein EVG20_g9192 [Dentipellis fragilis]
MPSDSEPLPASSGHITHSSKSSSQQQHVTDPIVVFITVPSRLRAIAMVQRSDGTTIRILNKRMSATAFEPLHLTKSRPPASTTSYPNTDCTTAGPSTSGSKTPSQPSAKRKYRDAATDWQREHRVGKNEKLYELNTLLPAEMQTFHDPPRLLPIVTNAVKYIEQLHKERKRNGLGDNNGQNSSSSWPTQAHLQDSSHDITQLQHNLQKVSLELAQYKRVVADLEDEISLLRNARNQAIPYRPY